MEMDGDSIHAPFRIVSSLDDYDEETKRRKQEQATKISDEFRSAVNRLARRVTERPGEDMQKLYEEAPFNGPRSDSEHARMATRLENNLRSSVQNMNLEQQHVPFQIYEVEEERVMKENLAKKAEDEKKWKDRFKSWDQSQMTYSSESKSKGGCQDCRGPCALDSRRTLMSCTDEPMLPELMADLLAQFFRMGWMTGSGGAMAAVSCDNRLLLSPSSLQKERIKPCDLFKSAPNRFDKIIAPECSPKIKPTACKEIFVAIMQYTGAKCVIHSHSKASNLVTRILTGNEWSVSGQEYIKGIYNTTTKTNLSNHDILVVPIIENMPTEDQLEPQIREVLQNPRHQGRTAILVRNHGVFVWGPTWQKTKIHAEIYEYLFDLSIDLVKMGLPLIRQEDVAAQLSSSPHLTASAPPMMED